MADSIFGIPVQRIVNDTVNAAGGLPKGKLFRSQPLEHDPDDPNAPAPLPALEYRLQGFIEDRMVLIENTTVPVGVPVLTIIGGSIKIVPAVKDRVRIQGKYCTLDRLIRADTASAVFEFSVTYA